ncbi:MAG: hypothetical protein FWG83_01015 [Oscillospiraceae bacterium]|nr:hypothetical protein [Oscillospiraceae bacterium]
MKKNRKHRSFRGGFRGNERSQAQAKWLKWLFYSLMLLFLYMVMAGGFFRNWQPILLIPLATAVAMRESELSASIFGGLCGLFIDLSGGKLFGFTGTGLMLGCLGAALLSTNLIKVNLINFLWVNGVVCFFMAMNDYLFRYVLFGVSNSRFILRDFIIPSHLSAVILSPLFYFTVRLIAERFSPHENLRISHNRHNRRTTADKTKSDSKQEDSA